VSTLDWLDRMVGPDRAELWAVDRAREYVDHDLLAPDAARRWVLEQADIGDPLVLASKGQVWKLPEDVDPDEIDAPARTLLVHERLADPARVDVHLVGEDGAPGTRDTVLVDVLWDYTLTIWMWWNDLEDAAANEAGQTSGISTTGKENAARSAPDDGAR
jgi:hypothetical protein